METNNLEVNTTKNKNPKGLVFKIISFGILGLLGLLALTIVFGMIFGYKGFIVRGESMEPIIHYYSFAVAQPRAPEQIKLGNAISYTSASSIQEASLRTGVVTHRLIRVVNELDEVIAEFRNFADYDASWEENGAYIVSRPDLSIGESGTVVEWYSGEEFTKDCIFLTQGTNREVNPLYAMASSAAIEEIPYQRIFGVVIFSIPKLGFILYFIQKNIILVAAVFISGILLYNLISRDLKANK